MPAYTLSSLAYLKIILHAAKYPSSACVGLLVGQQDHDQANPSSSSSNVVQIDDVVPLLHHWTELSPMMEVGLQLAELHVKERGRRFVGLYVCNEGLDDTTVPGPMIKVADAIKSDTKAGQALILVLDNVKLSTTEPALVPYLPSGSTWKATSLSSASITLSDPSIPATALQQIRAGAHKRLGDFDEHLEDVTVDWLDNREVTV